jgi:hypothetical protein
MTSISGLSVKQFTVQHNSAPNTSGNDHRHEIVDAAGGTKPPFGKCKRFRIAITKDGKACVSGKAIA